MGTGDSRAIDAVEHAIESPLLETSLDGAQSILLSITGGRDLSLFEVNDAAKAVADVAHPDANIIFGAMVDEKMGDEVWITVVATGYGEQPTRREAARPERSERGERRDRAERRERIPADHEPRVRRAARSNSLSDVDVPEFLPARASVQPPEGGSRSRSPAHRPGGGRRPARGRQRRGRRGGRGAHVLRGRAPAHRAGGRRVHARPHGRGREPAARLLRGRTRAWG